MDLVLLTELVHLLRHHVMVLWLRLRGLHHMLLVLVLRVVRLGRLGLLLLLHGRLWLVCNRIARTLILHHVVGHWQMA